MSRNSAHSMWKVYAVEEPHRFPKGSYAMSKTLLVIDFDNLYGAAQLLEDILNMPPFKGHAEDFLDDMCVVQRQPDGALIIDQKVESTSGSVLKGTCIGLLAGVLGGAATILPLGIILGVGLGAGLGGIAGMSKDIGIDNDFIQRTASEIRSNGSALFLLLKETKVPKELIKGIAAHKGRILATNMVGPAHAQFVEMIDQCNETDKASLSRKSN